MICIYNGILLSYKKECTSVHFNEVNRSRAYYTEWSKSEREKQISYINTYLCKLELWYWWTYLQDNKGEANIRNRLLDTVGKGVGGMNWESSIATYTYIAMCKIESQWEFAVWCKELKSCALRQPRGVECSGS